ncbi:MAG: DUF1643 domain-containing protein [Pseudomonadota bacterium]
MSAIISECGRYRYVLTRTIGDPKPGCKRCLFVMLNPSTADASEDDPTIRRCMGYAKAWGAAELTVVNLYALRATDPAELWKVDDPVGPQNGFYMFAALSLHHQVVCAWGANAEPDAVLHFERRARLARVPLLCLGINKDGSPKHPLYLRKDLEPVPWTGAAA